MSSVIIAGNTSGSVTLAAPDVAGTTTLTLPATSGTIVAPSSAGTSGQVLTSNGAGSNPTFQNLPAGGVTSLNGQTGAITNTSLYAIGSYINGRPANATNYAVNSTIAGSSLFSTVAGTTYVAGGVNNFRLPYGGGDTGGGQSTLINTGTWRCVSPAWGPDGTYGYVGLWVRIS